MLKDKSRINIIKLVIGYWLLVIGLTGCAKREIKNIDSKGTNIICFGDSITFGYGANPTEDYPSILAKMLNSPVINAGLDGDTSTTALQRIYAEVLEKDPLLVIIEFAGNDFLKKIPLEETVKNIETMIQKIQDKGAMVTITDVRIGFIMGNYTKEYKRLAKKYNAIFTPALLSGIVTNPKFKSDFLHPNADGYKIIAQRVYHSIIPYLNQNSLFKKK
jgi:acyl-CoA thioesterase-1